MVGLAEEGPSADKEHEDLVGLAFSGGGIRSASFNLGILQAIHSLGVLRHVDYLSTVSGGGYIGSYLSSLFLDNESAGVDRSNFPLKPDSNGKQPKRVIEFIRGGKYLLLHPLEFTSFYLRGVIVNNIVLFAGLFSVCALVAYLWRLLDSSWFADAPLGQLADWQRPFLPSLFFFCVWLAMRTYSVWVRGYEGVGKFHNILLLLTLLSPVIGAVMVAGNSQTEIPFLHPYVGYIRQGFVVVLALGLLPVLSPWRLLQRKKTGTQKFVFNLFSLALLAGLPLAILYYVGRDNASGYAADRNEIVAEDIADWRFLKSLSADYPKEWECITKKLGPQDHRQTVGRLLNFFDDVDERRPVTLGIIEREVPDAIRSTVLEASKNVFHPILTALNSELISSASFAKANANREVLVRGPLVGLAERILADDATQHDIETFNREYLEQKYGTMVLQVTGETTATVKAADQVWRLKVLAVSAAVFLVALILVDANVTSVHRYYSTQLAQAYITPARGLGRQIPLARLDNTARGGPYHLINTTVRIFGDRGSDPTEAFLFSHNYCGSERTGYRKTSEYMGGKADLANAMAISGGAVSPTVSKNWLVTAVMFVLNLRLGQWLPSPATTQAKRRPTLFQLLLDLRREPTRKQFCFVSDGGHHENLGLEALLMRKCRTIIVCDAGWDPEHQFADFTRVVRKSRVYHGIEFFDLQYNIPVRRLKNLELGNNRLTKTHHEALGIRYADGTTGLLVYIKPSFNGDEEIDLARYREQNPDFPQQATSNQFYDENQFESYRQLGHHIGLSVWKDLQGDELWHAGPADRLEKLASPFTTAVWPAEQLVGELAATPGHHLADTAVEELIELGEISKATDWSSMTSILMEHEDSYLRALSAAALGTCPNPTKQVFDALATAVSDPESDIRSAADASLRRLGQRQRRTRSRRKTATRAR